MSKSRIIALVMVLWLISSSLYAYYYVVSILNSGEQYDAYAMSWQFQLFMFSLFRLPLLLLALFVLIALVGLLPSVLNPQPRELKKRA